MIKVSLQPSRRQIGPQLKAIQHQLDKIPQKAFEFFKYGAPTPIRSGNARRNTKLVGEEIIADYPYAQQLNEGSSAQAPSGMSEPTIEHVRKLVDRAMKGKTI